MTHRTAKDISILTQVAFKGAVELSAATPGIFLTDEGLADFDATLAALTERLFDADEAASATYTQAAPAQPARSNPSSQSNTYDPTQGLADELGATLHIEVIGTQNGPFPAWFLADAAKKGTKKVWDNRAELTEHPSRPWFKDADNKDNKTNGFWPPKAR